MGCIKDNDVNANGNDSVWRWTLSWFRCTRLIIICLGVCPLYSVVHDDVIKWKYFSHYWPFAREIHRSPVNSPQKGQWRRALMFSLNGWVNNRKAGDLRRHRTHYDITVIIELQISIASILSYEEHIIMIAGKLETGLKIHTTDILLTSRHCLLLF